MIDALLVVKSAARYWNLVKEKLNCRNIAINAQHIAYILAILNKQGLIR